MMDEVNNSRSSIADGMPEVDDQYNTTIQEYVEIIRDLTEQNQVTRVKDIARLRGVTRSSVSTALNTLTDLGLVEHEHYGYVQLTAEGCRLGKLLDRRHEILLRFLRDLLRLDPDEADAEACTLEHAMSPGALNALLRYVNRIEKHEGGDNRL